MQQVPQTQLPHIEVPPGGMDIDELMDVTAKLADILEEETRCLRAMEIEALAKLHAKKVELTLMLEMYQKMIKQNPALLKKTDAAKLEEFAALSDDLTLVVEENFRRTAVARAVNQRVMQTIIETISEQHRPATYNRRGTAGGTKPQDIPMPLNLNQKA